MNEKAPLTLWQALKLGVVLSAFVITFGLVGTWLGWFPNDDGSAPKTVLTAEEQRQAELNVLSQNPMIKEVYGSKQHLEQELNALNPGN